MGIGRITRCYRALDGAQCCCVRRGFDLVRHNKPDRANRRSGSLESLWRNLTHLVFWPVAHPER
jgi:hypothetical protein